MSAAHHDIDLPSPLMTSEPGSFARLTIVERKPQIIHQVIEDNDYPPEILQALETFKQEIAGRPIGLLEGQSSDVVFWNCELAAYRGKTWLQMPWYLAESFFYRRLLQAVRYFEPGPWKGHDPFGRQKRRQERIAIECPLTVLEPKESFEALLHSSLWGNRADLSNYTVRVGVQAGLQARQERRYILVDHTQEVHALLSGGLQRLDIVNDNAGLELLFDLAMADGFLGRGWVQKVVFHLKDRPFFVSDAMSQDVHALVSLLRGASEAGTKKLGLRLQEYLAEKRLILRTDPFWTTCLMFRRLTPSLRTELARSDLIVLKGDVNYRRLLDDRHWPPTTPLDDIAAYFPSPFVVLRTLKGEIVAGLKPGQAKAVAAQDPTWLIDGQWGIIQLIDSH